MNSKVIIMINSNSTKYYDKCVRTWEVRILFVLFLLWDIIEEKSKKFNDTADRYEIFYRKI